MKNYRLVVRKHELVDYQQRDFFRVNHNFYDQDKLYKMHWYHSVELTYVVNGQKIQTYKTKQEEEKIVAPQGTLLVVNSGISHEIFVEKGLEGIVLMIHRDIIPYFYPECLDVNFNLDLNLEAKNKLIQNMLDLCKAKDENSKIKQNIIVLNIISILVDYLIDKNNVYREKYDEINELITSVTEYIDYNYFQHITLDEITAMSHYNKSYLSSIFKKKTGITIFEYIKNVRLQHSLHDLKTTNRTIVDIALSNGFASIQSFNKLFKKVYQMTPAQYRKTK